MTGVAQTSVSVLALPLAEFNRILAADPGCYRHFARLTLERYQQALRFLAESRRLSPEVRLRIRIADLAELRRLEAGIEEQPVMLDLSQSELGSLAGLSRPNLNARLRRLQNEGWIQLKRSSIRVLDADGLRASVATTRARGGREGRGRRSAPQPPSVGVSAWGHAGASHRRDESRKGVSPCHRAGTKRFSSVDGGRA